MQWSSVDLVNIVQITSHVDKATADFENTSFYDNRGHISDKIEETFEYLDYGGNRAQ